MNNLTKRIIKSDSQSISPSNLKVIFFDVGDTLYSSEEMEQEYTLQLQKLIAHDRGISIEEAEHIIDEQGKQIKGKAPHITKVSIMESLGYTRIQVHEAYNLVESRRFLHEDKELQQLIKNLKLRYKLGIITNFQKEHTKQIFDVLGISIDDFDYFIGEEDVKEIKPSLEPFHMALFKAKLPPSQAIYVADSITKDLHPAKQVGMHTIWVGGSQEKLSEKDKLVIDCVVNNVYQLAEILL